MSVQQINVLKGLIILKQLKNDNAANRASYVGYVYNIGESKHKEDILNSLPKEWSNLHRNDYIHIHDLDAYDLTYNCLTIDLTKIFPYQNYLDYNDFNKLIAIFSYIKELLTNLGNEQSGGMAFVNFDNEIALILDKLNIDINKNDRLIRSLILDFIIWCNNNHTRMGQTSYYITLNVGLASNDNARYICKVLLEEFYNSSETIIKPNIVFKVKTKINLEKDTKNHNLLELALKCTSKKMIPTYLLCDCKEDKEFDPYKLSIMGCRTRVVSDIFGSIGAVGRGNICNISINLPRLALEVKRENNNILDNKKLEKLFICKWDTLATLVKDILLDRFYKLCKNTKDNFPTNMSYQLWCEDFVSKDLFDIFKHGTLSIGFIGLSEAIEVLTKKKYYSDKENYNLAISIIKHMRKYCDELIKKYNLNFSLLATSGELISGRFIEYDKREFAEQKIFKKDYYTNSFHVDVDSNFPGFKKLEIEGPFHEYCNGGSISYLELGEAPLTNVEGLLEYVNIAIKNNVHYLGFNFPKDICKKCGNSGIFDICPICGSTDITRIRRVSGYLEILDGFTAGKKAEEKNRRSN